MITFKEFLQDFIVNDSNDTDQLVAEEITRETLRLARRDLRLDENIASEQRDELRKIMLTYAICLLYLGPTRVCKLFEFLKTSRGKFKNLTALIEEGKNKNQIQRIFLQLYRIIRQTLRSKDLSGRKDVKLVFSGTKLTIRGLNGTPTAWGTTGEFYTFLKSKIRRIQLQPARIVNGMYKNMNVNDRVFDDIQELFLCKGSDVDANATDDDKKQQGVTWADDITPADILAMCLRKKDKDSLPTETQNDQNTQEEALYVKNFLKTLLSFSARYGVAANVILINKLAGSIDKNFVKQNASKNEE